MNVEQRLELPGIQTTPQASQPRQNLMAAPGTPKDSNVEFKHNKISKTKERRFDSAYDRAYLIGTDKEKGLEIKVADGSNKPWVMTSKMFIDKIREDIKVANTCLDAYSSNFKQAEVPFKDEDDNQEDVPIGPNPAKTDERVTDIPNVENLYLTMTPDVIFKFKVKLYGVSWKYKRVTLESTSHCQTSRSWRNLLLTSKSTMNIHYQSLLQDFTSAVPQKRT